MHVLTDGHLKAWTYNPGQRRVRRNPNFEYDNPIPGFQGLMTIDATNGFVASEQSEKEVIAEALHRHRGNRSRVAEELGMHRSTLWRKMKIYGLVE